MSIPAPGQLGAGGLDVGDDQVQAPDRTGHRRVAHERDRAGRSGRGQLHDPEVLTGAVVDVQLKAGFLDVEVLGAVHVRDRNHHQLKLPVHGLPSLVRRKARQGPVT
jgi:hypothetical protein